MSKFNAFDVYLRGKQIDTVFFQTGIDVKYVYDSLVDHDGYNPEIVVKQRKD